MSVLKDRLRIRKIALPLHIRVSNFGRCWKRSALEGRKRFGRKTSGIARWFKITETGNQPADYSVFCLFFALSYGPQFSSGSNLTAI
jgi:hypothetical protein